MISDNSYNTLTPTQSVKGDDKPSEGTSINKEKWEQNIPQASTPVTTLVGSDDVFEPETTDVGKNGPKDWGEDYHGKESQNLYNDPEVNFQCYRRRKQRNE